MTQLIQSNADNGLSEAKACAICEKDEGTVEAQWDDRDVKVCPACFEYETGIELDAIFPESL